MTPSRPNKSRLYVCLYSRTDKPKMPGLEDTFQWGLMIGPKIVRGLWGPSVHGGDRPEDVEGHLFQVRRELRPIQTTIERSEAETGESVATGTSLAAAAPSDLTWQWVISEQRITPFLASEKQPHLVARFAIGKVINDAMMRIAILETPVAGEEDPDFNDMIWVREAIANVACAPRAMGTGIRLWETVREKCMWYMQLKKDQHRWDGRGQFDHTQIPTWDLMSDEELIK